MITEITNSPNKNKRYRVILNNGKHYDFGLKGGETYIDHKDKIIRHNYWARHMANKKEKQLITNLIPSPALFSAMILWGPHKTLKENTIALNELLEKKYNL